jgi:hypothetical protein
MQPTAPTTRTAADRFCTAWAFLFSGVLIGFGSCLALQDIGYSPLANTLVFQGLCIPIGFLVISLPRALLEIGRLIARHRRLAA